MDPRAGLDGWKISSPPGFDPEPSSPKSVAIPTELPGPPQKESTKINYELDTTGEKENRTSKKNVDGKSTSSHDNKKLEKQRGMAFGFRKTATAV